MWTGSSRGRRFEGFFACARLPSSPWLAFSWLPFPCFLFSAFCFLGAIPCFPFPASYSRGAWHRGECIGRGGCVGQARCQAPIRVSGGWGVFLLCAFRWLSFLGYPFLLPIPCFLFPGCLAPTFALFPASPSCLSALPTSVPLPISAGACSLARCIRGLGGESGL